MDWLAAGLGLVILLLAGDALVRGAVNLSLRLGVPALVVSLTVVAFGTSAPELLISVRAVTDGAPGLALGNVVGSNTANVLLVLGIPALISRLHCSGVDTRRNYVLMLAVSAVFVAACFLGPLTWIHGLAFLTAIGLLIADQIREGMTHRAAVPVAAEALEGADPEMVGWKISAFLIAGLVGLPIGAAILVDAAKNIAASYGVSDSVIGLTLVAIGTSLPELATSVAAAIRRQADVALGNVIGSNLFNILAIVGAASLFGAIPVDPAFLRFDLWVMLGASLLLAPFVISRNRDLTRRWGALLTVLYIVYVVMVVLHG